MITTCRLTKNARRLARDPQAMHRTIAHTLGERGLWALPDPRTLIIQHDQPICWHTSMEGVIAHSHTTIATGHNAGDRIAWALIANPTSAAFTRGQRGTVRPLPPDRWDGWVIGKLQNALDVDSVAHELLPTLAGIKPDRRVTHRRVCFSGTAAVRDANALDQLRSTGIGRGKAYGCGLLITREVTA